MEFKVEDVGSVTVVTAPEIHTQAYAPIERCAEELRDIVNQNLSRNILVDLARVEFIATALISSLVDGHMAISRRKSTFAL